MSTELQRVAKAAQKVTKGRNELQEAIRAAHAANVSIRAIAAAAGLSVGTIHSILKETQP